MTLERSLQYFETVNRQFEAAARQAPLRSHTVEIAGRRLRLQFAGAALEAVVRPALAHCQVDDDSLADVTIGLFDDASTGTVMPPPPWDPPVALYAGGRYGYTWRGEVPGFNSDQVATSFGYNACALSMLHFESRVGLFWTINAETMPEWERAAPLRSLLSWVLGSADRQLVHAAAVGTADGGVLLAGKGGSGKSTSALACLPSELGYLGDDYCLVALEPEPTIHSLYSSARVVHDNLGRVPHMAAAVAGGQHKALMFLQPQWPHKLLRCCPLRAILLPRLASDTALRAASPLQALQALAVSTMAQLPRAGAGTLRTLQRLVQSVPAYFLEVGPEVDRIPAAIKRLLSR